MIELQPAGIGNLELLKTIGLRALEESSRAFGSTYAREAQFEQDEWARRALVWNGERGIG
jgi:hypothetical protein